MLVLFTLEADDRQQGQDDSYYIEFLVGKKTVKFKHLKVSLQILFGATVCIL